MSAVFLLLVASSGLQPALHLRPAGLAISHRSAAPVCALEQQFSQRAALVSDRPQQGSRSGQGQQQSAQGAEAWGRVAAQGALTVLATLAVLGGDARAAHAENELAALAGSKSTAELVDPSCFAKQCKTQMETCAADGDCMKGLACTAKCMGDAQCTVGCFARYNDKALEKVLQCTIEDAGCIAIATQSPGGDTLAEAPLPPKALVKATPATMSGKWYKVLGFNPNYDCFECQRNSFAANGEASGTRPASQTAMDVGPQSAAVEVEYSMPRTRAGQPPQVFRSTLNEKLEFDAVNPRRTAHTEGRMFGLTFWENWYVIGENQPREPEFRFVYYTGKTLQNRYEGAFVYARKPELPQAAMPSIYKVAREAGLDPQRACCIDNSCFAPAAPVVAPGAKPPPFTPVAEAGVVGVVAPTSQLTGSADATADGPLGSLRNTVRDLTELLEDPRPYGDDLFSRQRPMTEVREYDANGFRTPGLGAR